MIQKTRGLVLRFVRYRETSVIVTLFTEAFGTHAYIVNNVRTAKTKGSMALFQPLTLLDLIVYHKPNQEVARIKEVKCLYAYQSISTNITKAGLAIFITELLNKVLKEESHPKALFEFLQTSLITLDHIEENLQNFHVVFMIQLSRYLGFGMNRIEELSEAFLGEEVNISNLEKLLLCDFTLEIPTTFRERKMIFEYLVRQYTIHVSGFTELKSLDIIKEFWK
ncbi:MAG: DNA repair protein RecO [Cyclobacteriaceae bacterium]|jgi:DNA repair protein RecO (recombination protein O)|nr:DNA repair protein RecO [Cyclobacteriaceae bacterium]